MPSPHIDITWEAAGVLAAIVVVLSGFVAWYVRAVVTSALAAFEMRFFVRLNGTYVRKEVCEAVHGALAEGTERRLVALEAGHPRP